MGVNRRNRQKLKTGDEVDVVYYRKMYCYLKNYLAAVRMVKRKLRRRRRRDAQKELRNEWV